MDSGWVGALASLVSALIITVTAIAAFRQLRHNRNANDIVVYLRLIEMMDSPEMVEARASLALVAAKIMDDPEYLRRLTDPAFRPAEFRGVALLLAFLEHISVLITRGGIAESLVLAEYADNFVTIWEQMRPAIAQRRIAFGPHTGRAFEHLAMRSRRYIDSGQMDREYAALERDPLLAGGVTDGPAVRALVRTP
jgi:hypothetical protein